MITIDIEATLKEGASVNGAWNRAQLALLGVPWPPSKGWKAKLVREGVRLSLHDHEQFLALRDLRSEATHGRA